MEDDVPMPEVLPDDLEEALRKRVLNANDRSHLCRLVVGYLIQKKKASNAHLKVAANKMAKRFSPIKRHTDPANVSED